MKEKKKYKKPTVKKNQPLANITFVTGTASPGGPNLPGGGGSPAPAFG